MHEILFWAILGAIIGVFAPGVLSFIRWIIWIAGGLFLGVWLLMWAAHGIPDAPQWATGAIVAAVLGLSAIGVVWAAVSEFRRQGTISLATVTTGLAAVGLIVLTLGAVSAALPSGYLPSQTTDALRLASKCVVWEFVLWGLFCAGGGKLKATRGGPLDNVPADATLHPPAHGPFLLRGLR